MRTLALMLALVCASAALAQGDRKALFDKLSKAYDRDGDGRLSQEERALMVAHLQAMRAGEPVVDERPTRLPAPDKLYKAEAGPLGWKSQALELPPAGAVKRALPVRVTWPERGEGPFPVILWSHGAFGSGNAYQPLARHWASHGYVVLQPTHPDSRDAGTKLGDKQAFLCWPQRPVEVSSLLDRRAELERRVPALAGKLDLTRVGCGGHSFGAGTSMLLAGVQASQGGARKSFRDERVRCALLLSAQGRGGILPDERCYRTLTTPAVVVTGTKDDSNRTGEPWTWRVEPYTFAPARHKVLLVIDGAYHNFGGVTGLPPLMPGSGALDGDHVRLVRSVGTALYDAYLRGDADARRFLASRDVLAATGGKGRYEHKGLTGLTGLTEAAGSGDARSEAERALDEALK